MGSTLWMQLLIFWVCGTELPRGENTWLPRHGMGMLWTFFPAFSWAFPVGGCCISDVVEIYCGALGWDVQQHQCLEAPVNIFWSIFGRNLMSLVFLPALIFQLELAWAQVCDSIPTWDPCPARSGPSNPKWILTPTIKYPAMPSHSKRKEQQNAFGKYLGK